jgi:hypothetical protein
MMRPLEMCNRKKLMVNKVRAYGSKRWTNRLMAKRLLRAYTIRDTAPVLIIRGGPILRRISPEDVLARIINHELLLEEARYVKNLSKGIVSTKKDNIALKASKKTKKKPILVESSSEEEQDEDDEEEKEYDQEEMNLFIKKFNKYMSKRRPFKGDKRRKLGQKECPTIVERVDTSLLNVHMREEKKMMTRKKRRRRSTRKIRSSNTYF